ncbi:hypothetical protein PanWU01x14_099790 [Parasponia andersonii]|uniref:Uncharacterized protein n=1 Tax=Parasponia andersonii TaxID=3476 RepID=A0A2P5D3E7_PARAD|nr:hypothetical protein PanWU01x14_099790 [Parasponia andersonii]
MPPLLRILPCALMVKVRQLDFPSVALYGGGKQARLVPDNENVQLVMVLPSHSEEMRERKLGSWGRAGYEIPYFY